MFEKPDRIPIYGQVGANLKEEIEKSFGSIEAFEDHYEFDYAHILEGPPVYLQSDIDELKQVLLKLERHITLEDVFDLSFSDPDDEAYYTGIKAQIKHHKELRDRFVFIQVPGCFEFYNDVFGIETHKSYMLEYPTKLRDLYGKLLKWAVAFAMNSIDLGVDMIHVSDDWGSQKGIHINKDIWIDLVFPYHKKLADMIRKRKVFLSLHSDGNINELVDGIMEIGYNVVHPWQESAGMSFEEYKRRYSDEFVLMGGLDVQATLGFKDYFKLQIEIDRVLRFFKDGRLLFCTSHSVQRDCSVEELIFTYDYIYKRVRELSPQSGLHTLLQGD
ncbi:MAG: uroporphyrinogen decarboxylase family protein [Candidatus Hydrogenedentes bacterium]|nr:uroporphyrinogen decarboxylase family protein [Candidatus Hydrogenedentota bacterium]